MDAASGWLRADGSVVDTATKPWASVLVSRLKAEANGDPAHPYYMAGATQARLPDLQDRYIKDMGISGLDSGEQTDADLPLHTHGISVDQSSPDTHTHTVNHQHSFVGKKTSNMDVVVVTVTPTGTHSHTASVPDHDHALPDLSHTHGVKGKKGTGGDGHSQLLSSSSTTDETTGSTPSLAGLSTAGKALAVTVVAASAGASTGNLPVHQHEIPNTDTYNGSTGGSAPNTHTHTATADDTGTAAGMDVDHTILRYYVFGGYPGA